MMSKYKICWKLTLILFIVLIRELPATSFSYNWKQLPNLSLSSSPSARYGASLAFDSAHGQLILFGGIDKNGPLADTWNWNGTTWTQLASCSSPSARNFASLSFDFASGQLILFGGSGKNGLLNDTWNWDGTS
jgi:hypothetical protein